MIRLWVTCWQSVWTIPPAQLQCLHRKSECLHRCLSSASWSIIERTKLNIHSESFWDLFSDIINDSSHLSTEKAFHGDCLLFPLIISTYLLLALVVAGDVGNDLDKKCTCFLWTSWTPSVFFAHWYYVAFCILLHALVGLGGTSRVNLHANESMRVFQDALDATLLACSWNFQHAFDATLRFVIALGQTDLKITQIQKYDAKLCQQKHNLSLKIMATKIARSAGRPDKLSYHWGHLGGCVAGWRQQPCAREAARSFWSARDGCLGKHGTTTKKSM